jgi:hypothetical protein
VTLYEFDDTAWGSVYPGPCTAQIAANAATATLYLSPGTGLTLTQQVVETTRPHYWFYTMAVDCSQGVALTGYTLTLTQADGNQLSYDQIGMPAINGCFWAVYLLGFLAHVWAHYLRQTKHYPLLVIFFTASLGLEMLSLFAHMIYWAGAQANGVGIPFFLGVGAFLRIVASMALWMTCGLAAIGYGVSSFSLSLKDRANWRPVLLLTALLCCYIGLAAWHVADQDPQSTQAVTSTGPAIALLVFTLIYAGWFYWRLRATYRAEITPAKKTLLWRLGLALGANFWVLPIAAIVGAATPPYEALRVSTGIDVFLITAVNAATAYVLWPSVSADAFRSFDGAAAAAMLGASSGGDDVMAGLDEAYAYAAMPAHESAGAGGDSAARLASHGGGSATTQAVGAMPGDYVQPF